MLCIRVLCDRSELMVDVFNAQCRDSLSAMLTARHDEMATNTLVNEQPDGHTKYIFHCLHTYFPA